MKRTGAMWVLTVFLAFLGLWAMEAFLGVHVSALYFEKLQTPLFSGFLTIAGFILSTQTLLLRELKAIFEDKDYIAHVKSVRLHFNVSYYGPLARLGSLLVWTIFSSLFTSIYQITFGLWKVRWFAFGGISLGFGTLFLVLSCWYHVRLNLKDWFDHLEKKAVQEETPKEKPPVEESKK